MTDDGCQSCDVPAKVCHRLRSVRAEACCTDCAMDAPGVLHGQPDMTPDDLAQTRARALADGRLAAFADATDLTPLLANRSGLVDPAGELHGIGKDLDNPRWAETLNRVARAIRGEDETDG